MNKRTLAVVGARLRMPLLAAGMACATHGRELQRQRGAQAGHRLLGLAFGGRVPGLADEPSGLGHVELASGTRIR